jgi:hypothetical protein
MWRDWPGFGNKALHGRPIETATEPRRRFKSKGTKGYQEEIPNWNKDTFTLF